MIEGKFELLTDKNSILALVDYQPLCSRVLRLATRLLSGIPLIALQRQPAFWEYPSFSHQLTLQGM